jgi:L-alanine-DL-glutamate epimerase-like enolase superfamily enzyme
MKPDTTNRHAPGRRSFLKRAAFGALGGAALVRPGAGHISAGTQGGARAGARGLASAFPAVDLFRLSKSPVRVERVELLRHEETDFVRATSADGAAGVAITNGRAYLHPLFKEVIAPFFVGRDARDLAALVEGVYREGSNYKLAGLAFWCCVGWLEVCLMDLLGRAAGVSVAEILGGARRRAIPVYLSSLTRETTPEQEVEWLRRRLAETGARAVKIKVGGRIGRPEPVAGRTERLVPLARKTFGDAVTIYADANGSYDVRRGVEVGRLLEAHGVAIYEEPCPFEEYEDTKRVADALTRVKVAGGEQDTSLARWRWITANRMVDVAQPDIYYNGGFLRTWEVARMAAARGIGVAPHNPKAGAEQAHLLQFAAAAPNLEGFQEVRGERPKRAATWYEPLIEIKDGALEVPAGPGLGVTIDPDVLRRARAL